jgi:hypothetical protein
MNKKFKPIARFGSPAEECRLWESHDSTDYVERGKAKRVSLPDLKMSRTAPRPSQGLLDRGEVTAGKREARCQSLVKVRLAERGDAE